MPISCSSCTVPKNKKEINILVNEYIWNNVEWQKKEKYWFFVCVLVYEYYKMFVYHFHHVFVGIVFQHAANYAVVLCITYKHILCVRSFTQNSFFILWWGIKKITTALTSTFKQCAGNFPPWWADCLRCSFCIADCSTQQILFSKLKHWQSILIQSITTSSDLKPLRYLNTYIQDQNSTTTWILLQVVFQCV